MTISKKEDSWYLNRLGHPPRVIDPLLLKRLEQELSDLRIIETRPVDTDQGRKAFGVSAVALTMKVMTQGQKQLRFRVGIEYQRDSAWVLPLNEQGQPAAKMLRIKGRLRRALDHAPSRWPDRRLAHNDPHKLVEISCVKASRKEQPSHTYWLLKREEQVWQLVGKKKKAVLDPAAVQTLAYTLGSLRFDRYLAEGDLTSSWRPAYTFKWVDQGGIEGSITLGRTRIRDIELPVWVGKGPAGLGLLPDHLTSWLSPRIETILARGLLPVEVASLLKISFQPAPIPLASQQGRKLAGWSIERKSTGWWLTTPHYPIAPQELKEWFTLLDQDTASAELWSNQDVLNRSGARLEFTTRDQAFCLALNEPVPCSFFLDEELRPKSDRLSRWLRSSDEVIFTMSPRHRQAVMKGPH